MNHSDARPPFRPALLLAAIAGPVALALTSLPAEAQQVTRGPYLTGATQTRMVVKWRTVGNSTTGIWWGPEGEAFTDSIQVGPASIYHSVALTGLTPGTRYRYEIGTATGRFPQQLPEQHFETLPPTGSRAPFSAWIFGDSGWIGTVPANLQDDWFEYADGAHPDVWVLLGDNAYLEGEDFEYQDAFFEPFQRTLAGTPAWSTRGNHESLLSGSENDYYDFFQFPASGEAGGIASGSEAYYSFDYANVHFVCLDSEGTSRNPGSPMLVWLENDLAATTQDWIVVFFHHPPYSKGSHDSDSEGQLIQMRQNVGPILEAHGVDFVFAGHSHAYERSYLLDGHYGVSATFEESMKVDGGNGDPLADGAYVKPEARTPHAGTVYTVAGTGSIIYPGSFDHPAIYTHLAIPGALYLEFDGLRAAAAFRQQGGLARDQFVIDKSASAQISAGTGSPRLLLWSEPNPSADEHRILCSLSQPGRVRLAVFDSAGRRLGEIFDGPLPAGQHDFHWDGRNSLGRPAPTGVYMVRGSVDGERELTARVVRIR